MYWIVCIPFFFVGSSYSMYYAKPSSSPTPISSSLRSSGSSSTNSLGSSPKSVASSSSVAIVVNPFQEKLVEVLNAKYIEDTSHAKELAQQLVQEGFPACLILDCIRPQNCAFFYTEISLEQLSQQITGLYEMRILYYQQNSGWEQKLFALVEAEILSKQQVSALPNYYKSSLPIQYHEASVDFVTRMLSVFTIIDNYTGK